MASLRTAILQASSLARAPLAQRIITPTSTPTPTTANRLGRGVLQQQNRPIHTRAALARPPYKDDMDRESLKPKAHEYTQSGTDDEVAASDDAAFNPHKTSPEAEKDAAGDAAAEKGGAGAANPLDASPANRDFAGADRGDKEERPRGGGGQGKGQGKASGQGKPPKKGKVA